MVSHHRKLAPIFVRHEACKKGRMAAFKKGGDTKMGGGDVKGEGVKLKGREETPQDTISYLWSYGHQWIDDELN